MRGTIFCLAGLALGLGAATPALAQYDLTEAQKRKAHVPYVRILTNCFAGAIAGNVYARSLSEAGKWPEAIKITTAQCSAQLSDMIESHDRIYGRGTGMPFATGPYFSDLPRALSSRIARGSSSQTTTSAANLPPATKAPGYEAPLDAAKQCTMNSASVLAAASTDNSDLVAVAAFEGCYDKWTAAISAMLRENPSMDRFKVMENARTTWVRRAMTAIIQDRAKANLERRLSAETDAPRSRPLDSGL